MNYPTAPDNLTAPEFWGHFYALLDETVKRGEEILAKYEQTKTAPGDTSQATPDAADRQSLDNRLGDNNTITGQGQTGGEK